MMVIDKTKKYQTRDGREVRIYTVDGGGSYPIHGAIFDKVDNCWCPFSWPNDGKFNKYCGRPREESRYDLTEISPESWLFFSELEDGRLVTNYDAFDSREDAIAKAKFLFGEQGRFWVAKLEKVSDS
jgi:hypothetical protein